MDVLPSVMCVRLFDCGRISTCPIVWMCVCLSDCLNACSSVRFFQFMSEHQEPWQWNLMCIVYKNASFTQNSIMFRHLLNELYTFRGDTEIAVSFYSVTSRLRYENKHLQLESLFNRWVCTVDKAIWDVFIIFLYLSDLRLIYIYMLSWRKRLFLA